MEAPFIRHRNLRKTSAMRDLVRETKFSLDDLIYPMFVKETGETTEIPSMPGIYQYNLSDFEKEIQKVQALGIQAVLLFGIPAQKDAIGSGAFSENGIIQQAIRLTKERCPQLIVIADTCLCEYTDHGHCGVLHGAEVDNDASLEILKKTAISQAASGADMIAPSNAMDGFVYAIRQGLDEAGFQHVPIMSYAIKYASSFYGPFRDAAGSAPQFGDRKTYQMDPANRKEALREMQSDVAEGADLLIVKPGLAFLDIVRDVRNQSLLPIVCYNVSGEYSMVKAAAQKGWINEAQIIYETIIGMKRAGADLIITYFAKQIAQERQKEE